MFVLYFGKNSGHPSWYIPLTSSSIINTPVYELETLLQQRHNFGIILAVGRNALSLLLNEQSLGIVHHCKMFSFWP